MHETPTNTDHFVPGQERGCQLGLKLVSDWFLEVIALILAAFLMIAGTVLGIEWTKNPDATRLKTSTDWEAHGN